ncbi:hypothetical protein TNCV_2236991 [Trichonephila clavipes]|nr:hypothetical protein TNCV_2236991 [Trichonephila clavipes]
MGEISNSSAKNSTWNSNDAPWQRIFPLEVQAIANSDKELKEESVSVKSTKPEKVLNINDAIIKNILLLEDWLKNQRDLIS